MTEAVEAARPGGLPALIAAVLDTYENADAEHKLQIDALGTLPPDMRAPLIALQRRLVVLMSEAIATRRPGLAPDRLRALTMSVFGILNWFYMWHRPGKGLSRAEYAALASDFVEGGLQAV